MAEGVVRDSAGSGPWPAVPSPQESTESPGCIRAGRGGASVSRHELWRSGTGHRPSPAVRCTGCLLSMATSLRGMSLTDDPAGEHKGQCGPLVPFLSQIIGVRVILQRRGVGADRRCPAAGKPHAALSGARTLQTVPGISGPGGLAGVATMSRPRQGYQCGHRLSPG